MFACMHRCIYAHTYSQTHTCTHTHTHTCMPTCACMQIQAGIIYARTHAACTHVCLFAAFLSYVIDLEPWLWLALCLDLR